MTRHIIMRTTVGSLLLSLAVVGCSSTTDDGGGGGNPNAAATADEIVNGLVDAYCDTAMRCGEMPVGNKETCVAYFMSMEEQGLNSFEGIRKSFESGQFSATKGSLKGCFDAIRALDCYASFEGGFGDFPACAEAFTGTVADGQACLTDLACSSANSRCIETWSDNECALSCEPLGTRCRGDADCTDGKFCENSFCKAPETTPGGEGADCSQGERCQAGLTCIPQSNSSYTCSPRSGAGGPCGWNDQCQSGLVCNRDNWPGTCGAPPARIAEGQPCELEDGDSLCAEGLVCVPADDFESATCEKASKKKGESCTRLLECGGFYSLYICDTTTKKCVDRPTSGPCPIAQFGTGCHLFDAYCDVSDSQNPTCRTHKALGAACTDSEECGGPGSRAYCDKWSENPTNTCVADEPSLCLAR